MYLPILLMLFLIAAVLCGIGFFRYIYFFSVGYGLAVAGIGAGLLFLCRPMLTPPGVWLSVILILYGLRLAGYLILREIKSGAYRKLLTTEIKKNVSVGSRLAIWLACSLLYICQCAPVLSRVLDGGTDVCCLIGTAFALLGVILETAADICKSAAKKKSPGRFVDTGLYRLVRCPNYFGELLLWTGVLLCGVTVMKTPLEWILAVLGYLGIVYVIFSGARRLELRQERVYGDDPAYRAYVKKTPILLPLIPLYSVKKWTWFVA